jgi:outer membrane protein assembly factor BamB
LGIVSQTTGAVTIVGQPAGVVRISGLAFDSTGTLFASTLIPAGGFPPPSGPRTSELITINPLTGALVTSNPITIGVGGPLLAIADLSVQPGTNTLFGVTNPDGPNGGPGDLYTINSHSGVATLVGNTGHFFNSIAFAPNGTLYLAAENLGAMGPDATTTQLDIINPATGATLSSVPTLDFFGALGVRSDGTIFGGNGDLAQLFTINATTGAETLIGSTGTNLVGDLAFQTPDTGTTFGLMLIAFGGLAACAKRLAPAKASR